MKCQTLVVATTRESRTFVHCHYKTIGCLVCPNARKLSRPTTLSATALA